MPEGEAVAELDVVQVGQDLIVQQLQAVADAQVVLRKGQAFAARPDRRA